MIRPKKMKENKTITFASIRRDGTLITSEGLEEALSNEVTAPILPQQVEAIARRSPDASPPSVEDFQPIIAPRIAALREALALTRTEFAKRYHIPLATLHDWEHELSEPDQSMRAYLTVIARHPTIVLRALQRRIRADRSRARASENYLAHRYPGIRVKNPDDDDTSQRQP